ncbi:MAG TPA: hypothetical protein VMF13_18025 [Luteitalea sp.]|nr:hypothetical protein [Luteitalea sp.]
MTVLRASIACLALGAMAIAPLAAAAQDVPAAASTAAVTRVRVTDRDSGVPIAGVELRCGADPVARTDSEGQAIVAGCTAAIDASLDDYANALVHTPLPTEVEIRLARQPALTDSVTVIGPGRGQADAGVPAQIGVTREELALRRSVTLDDPLRALQQLPGVGTSDELRAELSVRGSPFRQVGLVLDEVKSRLLVHTVRGVEQTGSVALLNGDLIDAVTLTSGSGPQRFGNTVGAELAVRTRTGRTDGWHGRVLAGAIASSGSVEGPLVRDRVTLIAGLRRSYASWLVRRVDPDVSGTFEFTDTQLKLDARLTDRQHVSAGLLAGASTYDERGRRTHANALDVGHNRTAMGTLAWQWVPGARWMVRQRVAGISSDYRNDNPDAAPLDDGSEHEWLSRTSVEWAPTASVSVDGAAQVQRFGSRGTSLVYDPDTRQPDPGVTYHGTQTMSGGHAHARWSPHRAVTVAAGARVDRVTDLAASMGGWTQAQVALTSSLVLSASVSRHTQAPDVWQRFGPAGTASLAFESARLIDAGVGWRRGGWSVLLTGYHRHEREGFDTPGRLFRIGANGRVTGGNPRAPWSNALKGSARGAEAVLRRQSAGGRLLRWSGWVGYGYGRMTQSGGGDPEFAGAFDQRHLVTVSLATRIGDAWDASASVRMATNWPYDGWFETATDGRIRLSRERNALRLPDYGRGDLRVRRRVTLPHGRLFLFAEVVNVANTRNLRQVSASIDVRTGAVSRLSERQLPIIPAIGAAFEF